MNTHALARGCRVLTIALIGLVAVQTAQADYTAGDSNPWDDSFWSGDDWVGFETTVEGTNNSFGPSYVPAFPTTSVPAPSGPTFSFPTFNIPSIQFPSTPAPKTPIFNFPWLGDSWLNNPVSDIGTSAEGHNPFWNDSGWADTTWMDEWWKDDKWHEKSWGDKTGYPTTEYNPTPKGICGPAIKKGLVNYHFECLNDSTFLDLAADAAGDEQDYGWQYAVDSDYDGIGLRGLGAFYDFEMQGIAFRELPTTDTETAKVVVAISSTLPYSGVESDRALGGIIGHGDIFFNFGMNDFESSSDAMTLFAVRFADSNDSGVAELGLYRNVMAQGFGAENQGFGSLQAYEDRLAQIGGVLGYGDLPVNQTYYSKESDSALIKKGDFLGGVNLLTLNDLLDRGFDPTRFCRGTRCDAVIGFEFDRDLIVDDCGVFGGDGTSCLDCAGIACGTTVVDGCGVCGGDGSTCLDCKGIPGGEAMIDQCGICGGDGTSCLDCAGDPNGKAVVDRCGVCNGDGTSCTDCEVTDLSIPLFELDAASLRQRDVNRQATSLLRKRARNNRKAKAFAKKAAQQAEELHLQNWTTSWTFPSEVKTCADQTRCVTVSQEAGIASFASVVDEQLALGKRIVRRLRKVTGKRKFGRKLLKRMNRERERALDALSVIPSSQSVCQ